MDGLFFIRSTNLGLTKREIEICDLVRDSRIYKEICESLLIPEKTVNKHMQNIFIKARSRNKVDLLNKITGDVKRA